MGQYIGGAISIFALAITLLSGMALAGAEQARATISAITTQASKDMAVDGGYTAAVQAAIQAALVAHGLNGSATASVTPGGPDYYGETYTVTIDYQLPVILPGGAVTVPLSTSAPGVSTYPCTAAEASAGGCAAPPVIGAGGL